MMPDDPTLRWWFAQALNGNLFYVSLGLLVIVGGLRIASTWVAMYRWRHVLRALGLLGLIGLALSAASVTFAWTIGLFVLWFAGIAPRRQRTARIGMALLAAGLMVIAAAQSWRYEYGTRPRSIAPAQIVVLGDSLSAPYSVAKDEAWPALLAKRLPTPINSAASGGAKLATFCDALDRQPVFDSLVIVELGGNDVLASTPIRTYGQHLNELLLRLHAGGNQIVLLEVPASPLAPWYDWVQQHLARRYRVRLIPKRLLADLIFAGDNTQDGLHLTADGHRQMADQIERWLRHWFVLTDAGDYAPTTTDDMLNDDDLPHSWTTGSDQQRQGDR